MSYDTPTFPSAAGPSRSTCACNGGFNICSFRSGKMKSSAASMPPWAIAGMRLLDRNSSRGPKKLPFVNGAAKLSGVDRRCHAGTGADDRRCPGGGQPCAERRAVPGVGGRCRADAGAEDRRDHRRDQSVGGGLGLTAVVPGVLFLEAGSTKKRRSLRGYRLWAISVVYPQADQIE